MLYVKVNPYTTGTSKQIRYIQVSRDEQSVILYVNNTVPTCNNKNDNLFNASVSFKINFQATNEIIFKLLYGIPCTTQHFVLLFYEISCMFYFISTCLLHQIMNKCIGLRKRMDNYISYKCSVLR